MSKNRISEKISELNKKRILYYLFKHHTLYTTRSHLVKVLNISFPAVSNNLSQLIEEGYISEKLDNLNSIGRKSKKISLNPSAKSIIFVHIEYQNASFFLVDLKMRVLKIKKITFERNINFLDLWTMIEKEIKSINQGLSSEKAGELLGVSIAVPAPVDKLNHKLIKSRFYGWKEDTLLENINLDGEKIPVFWENDSNLLAKGFYESSSKFQNVLAIYFSMGIGMGMIINGELYRGIDGNAGEIGQLKIEHMGSYEELEKVISEKYLIDFAKNRLNISYNDSEKILVELERNNKLNIVYKEFENISNNISKVFAPIIMALEPEVVVIDGTVKENCPSLIKNIISKIEELTGTKNIFKTDVDGNFLMLCGGFWEVLDNTLNFCEIKKLEKQRI